MRLSKAGYGSLNEVEQWDTEKTLSVFEYDIFLKDLEEAFFELNFKDKK